MCCYIHKFKRDSITRFFASGFFSWIIFFQAPENNIRFISIFFLENLRRYLQVKVHGYRWCRWYRGQIMGTISGWTGWNKMYLYVNSTTQRCPNKIFKTFLIEDLFHLPPVSTTLVDHLELRISLQIFQKTLNGPIGILRGLEEMIHVYYIYRRILWTLFELLTTPSNFCAPATTSFLRCFQKSEMPL